MNIEVDREFAKAYLEYGAAYHRHLEAGRELEAHHKQYTYAQLADKRTNAHKREHFLQCSRGTTGQQYAEARDKLLSLLNTHMNELPAKELRDLALTDKRFVAKVA